MPTQEPFCPKCRMYWPPPDHPCFKDMVWWEAFWNDIKGLSTEPDELETEIERFEGEGGIYK